MSTLLADLRYAARGLLRTRAFALIAVASLAIGIGANVTLFSVVRGVLLHPLPVSAPERLVTVQDAQGLRSMSYLEYVDLAAGTREVFSDVAAWGERTVSLTIDGRAERAYGLLVSGNFFTTLGVRPAAGRVLVPTASPAGAADQGIVLSDHAWRTRFGADPSIVGRVVRLNGAPFVVAGVAPAGFTSPIAVYAPDFYAPIAAQPQLAPGLDITSRDRARWIKVSARLRPGVSAERAEAVARTVNARIVAVGRDAKREADQVRRESVLRLLPFDELPDDIRMGAAGLVGFVALVSGLVLLVACANVSSMLLARAASRQREIAVRRALGAGAGRIVRQLLTESALLAALAGLAGVLLALWLRDLLLAFRPPVPLPVALDAPLDGRALAFATLLAAATALLFGLAPALHAARRDLASAIGGAPAAGRRRPRLRGRFVLAQLAMTMILLTVGNVFLRALARGRTITPVADPASVWLIELSTGERPWDDARRVDFYRQLLDRVRRTPGLRDASLASEVPVGGGYTNTEVVAEGRRTSTEIYWVSPGYFATLGLDVARGRDFADADRAGAARVVILNESAARHFFPGGDALGRHLTAGGDEDAIVVGIVRDAGNRSLVTGHGNVIYASAWQQRYAHDLTLHLRPACGGCDARALLDAVRREITVLDPAMPLDRTLTMEDLLGLTLLPHRIAAAASGALGAVGLLLAALGIYGGLAYLVAERTREIAIRAALGARRADVLSLVTRDSLRLAVVGSVLGVAAALPIAYAMRALLFGVGLADAATLLGGPLALAAAAALASAAPARRAMRIAPMEVLRSE